jgi:transposase InsO family protein
VLGELRIQGFTAHGRAIERGLAGRDVPKRLIRDSVREIKRTMERDAHAYREERMTRIEVLHSGTVTAIDTTHVAREPVDEQGAPQAGSTDFPQETTSEARREGREGAETPGPRGEREASREQSVAETAGKARGRAIQALIAVDVATTFKLAFKIVRAPCGQDVIDMLVAIKEARGSFPFVLVSDNGTENVNAEVKAFLEQHQIVHLRNAPHTPRHNPSVERAHREVKAEAVLDLAVMDTAVPLFERIRASIGQAVNRLNTARLRESRGWKTAAQLDTELRAPYAVVDRNAFYAVACSAARAARSIPGSARDQRLAERWATLRVMEAFGLVKLFRGGVPITAIEAERVT